MTKEPKNYTWREICTQLEENGQGFSYKDLDTLLKQPKGKLYTFEAKVLQSIELGYYFGLRLKHPYFICNN